jgi:membrane associated rhomboid family serine protease
MEDTERPYSLSSILKYPLMLLVLLWVVFIADKYLNLGLMYYGIYPRRGDGITGILTAPFIHGDWSHLIANSSPMLVLTAIMVSFYKRVALTAFIVILISTGLLVWLFGRESYHIGASGVVYGLVSFIFWTGIFRKNPKSIVLSLIIIILYSGMSEGLFPSEIVRISWESHLFGAFSGLWVAFILKNVKEDDESPEASPWESDQTDRPYFLPRDAFEKTKIERYYENLYQKNQDSD